VKTKQKSKKAKWAKDWRLKKADVDLREQVPHSQWSLKENLNFLQNLKSKNNTVWENFWLIFLFNVCHCNSGLAFKSKNYYIAAQNCKHFIRENTQKIRQKHKWALWMRHQRCLLMSRCWLMSRQPKEWGKDLNPQFHMYNEYLLPVFQSHWSIYLQVKTILKNTLTTWNKYHFSLLLQ
jgi:hypothetical protein